MEPEIPVPHGSLLTWLAENPEALPRLVRFYNRHRKLEIHVTQNSTTKKFHVQTAGENAVVKIDL